ncbi:GNAT family N-acetyltransferase [Amycolatopsis sp. NPDC003861]
MELHLDGTEVGAVTASPCASCRTATLDYVHVAAEYRRLGFGRTLVAAVVARAPSYRWTAPLPNGPVAQSFRARIAMRRADLPCVHADLVERRR